MKAADISDEAFLRLLNNGSWTHRWDMAERLPGVPEKVVLAKARRLIQRGLMDGCFCGCRGDFEITAKGIQYLATKEGN